MAAGLSAQAQAMPARIPVIDIAALYGTDALDRVRERYDPDGRLSTLYEKAVGNS